MLLIPTKALRDEGASYHYVAPSRYIEVDSRALTAIETVLKGKEIPLSRGHDLVDRRFYRETPDKVAYRIEEGCSVVEMECLPCCSGPNFVRQFGACPHLPQILLQTWKIMTSVTGVRSFLRRP